MILRAREGDFIETHDNLIFDVKGLVHPPNRVIAYLRYIQDPMGDRRRRNRVYKKVYSLGEREKLLEREYPHYLFYDQIFSRRLQGVSSKHVSIIHQPTVKVSTLLEKSTQDRVEMQAIDFVKRLHESSGVSYEKLGISGSILVGLHTKQSDIDPIVYGRQNCVAVYTALKRLMQEREGIFPYTLDALKKLYLFRSRDTQVSWNDFLRIERRKVSQGKYMNKDFFIRFVLDWNEVDEKYGDRQYVPLGFATIKGRVEDASNSIFTPCSYKLSQTEILDGETGLSINEVVSYRGRFCEQADQGETITARGKIEKVTNKDGTYGCRLILGEETTDFMLSTS